MTSPVDAPGPPPLPRLTIDPPPAIGDATDRRRGRWLGIVVERTLVAAAEANAVVLEETGDLARRLARRLREAPPPGSGSR